jgi:hypothetical protein
MVHGCDAFELHHSRAAKPSIKIRNGERGKQQKTFVIGLMGLH